MLRYEATRGGEETVTLATGGTLYTSKFIRSFALVNERCCGANENIPNMRHLNRGPGAVPALRPSLRIKLIKRHSLD